VSKTDGIILNKMKKISIVVLIVLLVLFIIIKGLEWIIESKFQAIINSNPDRAYNITYSDFDLDIFFTGVTLDETSIVPLNPQKGTMIRGSVDYATINGIAWKDLLFNKKLYINEIAFEQPIFEVTLSAGDTTKTKTRKGIQAMFGDILSRANINSFRIDNGSVVFKDSISQAAKGEVKRLNILATDIETDTLKFNNLIPFEMGNLELDIDSISLELNDYTHVELGRFNYNQMEKEILLNDKYLGY
jgi:hypothetical protein